MIVPFHMKHGRTLSTQPDFVLEMYQQNGVGYTALVDNEPIAASGIMLTGNGNGSAWGMITDRARSMPFMLHRAVIPRLYDVIARHQLRRVDYIVDSWKPTAMAWAKRLGFTFEGEMRAFYPDGHSAYLFAWIHPDYRRSDEQP